MNTDYLEQPSHIQASILLRFTARLIDRFITILILIAVLIIFNVLTFLWSEEAGGIYLGIIAALVYSFAKDALPYLNGVSIGKRIMGIRVVSYQDGRPITHDYKKAIVREIVTFIPLLNLIDIAFIFRGEGRRLGDEWADTIVVEKQ